MKKFLLVPALAAFFAVQSASAIGITLIQFTPNSTGPANPDLTFESGFNNGPQGPIAVLGGASLTYDGAVIVQAINDGNGAPPFPTTEGKYLSVMTGGNAEFKFTSNSFKTFGFMWGSIDDYNTITFSGGSGVYAFNGSGVVSPPVNDNGYQGFNGSAYVVFAGAFDTVVLTSTQNSFEIDNVNVHVPDGGMTLALLGLSLLGLPFIRRFTK